MSYPGLPNYPSYQYASGVNEQDTTPQYLPGAPPSSLQSSARGYNTSVYDWQGQTSQEASVKDTRQMGNRWAYAGDQNAYPSTSSQQRLSGNNAQAINPVSYNNPTAALRQSQRALDTPALHSLAYASGLESELLNRQTQGSSPAKTVDTARPRVSRPGQTLNSLNSSAAARPYAPVTHFPPSGHSQSSPQFSAALPSRSPSHSYSPASQIAPNPTTYSQSVYDSGSKSSTPNPPRANPSPVPGTTASYSSRPAWTQAKHTNSREGLSSSQRQDTYLPRTPSLASTSYGMRKDLPPTTTAEDYTSNNATYDATGRQSEQGNSLVSTLPQASASTVQHHTQDTMKYPSIPVESLYTTTDSSHSLSEEAWGNDRFPGQQSPSGAMPSYIDPTQVFNPYRQEYEQMQALRAEEEAKRKQDEAKNTAKQPDTATHSSATSAVDAKGTISEASVSGHQTVASDNQPSKKKPRKRAPRKSAPAGSVSTVKSSAGPREENIDPQLRSQTPQNKTGDADGDMANEMKMMIEKMRQWRSKDPTLFAKLWDDVRKGQGSTPDSSTAPEAPQQTAEPAATLSTAPELSESNASQSDKKRLPSHYIDGLPDLGRFPAQRRRRQSNKVNANETATPKRKLEASSQQTGPSGPPSEGQIATNSLGAQLVQSQQSSQSRPVETLGSTTAGSSAAEVSSASQSAISSAPQPPSQEIVSGSAQQHAPQPQQTTTGTIWPEHTRQAVAQALVQYLNTIPANKGKCASAKEMSALVDKNSSYIELCINGSASATQPAADPNSRGTLLPPPPARSAPPAPAPPAPAAPAPVAPPAPAAPPTQTAPPAPAPPPPRPSAAPVSQAPRPYVPPPAPQAHTFVWNSKVPTVHGHPPPVTGLHHRPPALATPPVNTKKSKSVPRPSGPLPGPKEQKARKHLFSEIVDLTSLSDEDEAVRRAEKEPRLESTDPSLGSQPDITVAKAQNHQPSEKSEASQQLHEAQAPAQQGIAGPMAAQSDLSRFAMAGDDATERESLRRRADIVKPINKMEALRRKYYNPKTIARDVLIAAGRHPTERPLNSHLQGLQEIFSAVDFTSDMGTFRWDLVDPGGPPAPVVEPEDILLLPPNFPLGVRSKGAASSSREERDAGSEARPASPANLTQSTHKPSSLSFSQSINDSSPALPKPDKGNAMVTPAPRRRGRPPGSKNKNPTKAAMRGAKVEVAVPVQSSPPRYSIYRCEWENCDAELHDLKTFERHLRKVHAPSTLTCAWFNCPAGKTAFKTNEDLCQHLKQTHVASLAWQLGDGPLVGRTVPVQDFLHGPQGSSITPEAPTVQKKRETGAIVFPTGFTPIRAFNQVRGNASVQEKAREAFRAVEQRMVRIGFALEPSGCELASPRRLFAVSNDEEHVQLKPPGRRVTYQSSVF
ncbi:hypothetical protein DTO195F2_6355 [Paecilomyces variotii]|nr:hypothetical protein DTO195F2_6355 [Paecilomyces variotii]KAJ9367420.1 hypothetical protein DTO282E5_7872 [Paecilomyces variotii]